MGQKFPLPLRTAISFLCDGATAFDRAMANMTAGTHRYGPSHLAFIVVPLVYAFFVDIVNAFMIQFLLEWL